MLKITAPNTCVKNALEEALVQINIPHQCTEDTDKPYVSIFDQTAAKDTKIDLPLRMGRFLDIAHTLYQRQKDYIPPFDIKTGTLDVSRSKLCTKKQDILLTDKECDLIRLLYRTSPNHVTRQEILQSVWGHTQELETHTLETHIYRLRQKIENDPSSPEALITEEAGYKLNIIDKANL